MLSALGRGLEIERTEHITELWKYLNTDHHKYWWWLWLWWCWCWDRWVVYDIVHWDAQDFVDFDTSTQYSTVQFTEIKFR